MANQHSVGLGEAPLRGEGRPDGRLGDCVRGRSQQALPRHAESAPRGGAVRALREDRRREGRGGRATGGWTFGARPVPVGRGGACAGSERRHEWR